MALGEAFRRLKLNFNGPVCISLLRGSDGKLHSIIEAWPA
jgi:hypothetical protein